MNKFVFSFIFTSTLVFVPTTGLAFSDITISDPIYPDTTYLEQHNIFKGYDDGSFGRNKLINRAEALKTILTAAEVKLPEELPAASFSDVPRDTWFTPYVDYAASKGIISGDGNSTQFSPGRTVNKAEFVKMLMKAFDIDPKKYDLSEIKVNDVPDEVWFAPYMKFGIKFKVLTLDESGNINPGKELTRGDSAQLIFSMLRRGKGLKPQTLLNLAELHLIKSLEFIDKGDIPTAALLISIAEKYSAYALEILPENNVVQSAEKVVSALKSIVGAFASKQNAKYDDIIANAKQAWKMADESFKLNANNKNLSEKIKKIASSMADKARAAKAGKAGKEQQ